MTTSSSNIPEKAGVILTFEEINDTCAGNASGFVNEQTFTFNDSFPVPSDGWQSITAINEIVDRLEAYLNSIEPDKALCSRLCQRLKEDLIFMSKI